MSLARALCLLFAALALGALPAHASRRFPQAIRDHLSLGYTIQCSLCHLKGNTGPGTAETPFAISARARGLQGGDTRMLLGALDLLQTDQTDSDHDGVSDIDELIRGTDPNVFGPVSTIDRVDPSYGCSSAAAPLGLPLAALFGWLLVRRPRARSPSRAAL